MNDNEKMIEQMEAEITKARLDGERNNLSNMQKDTFLQAEERSMAKDQLDLSEMITRTDYLLRGYSLRPDGNGKLQWTKPVSQEMEVFTDYGVQMIMNTMCFYLNQNTLLSNYKDEEINDKMRRFTKELVYAIFMNYNKVFKTPSVDDCIKVIVERLNKQAKVTKAACELTGDTKTTIEEIYKEKVKAIEFKIENEIEKIRQSLIKEKLRRFPLLIRVIQDPIHSTYKRAWNGQERSSLRQHMSISESKGTSPFKQESGGLFNWGKK